VPLARATFLLRPPVALRGTPGGDRLLFEVVSGEVTGDRLRARLVGTANADWFVMGPEGTGTLDVRLLLETDDGALILVQYTGRTDLSVPGSPAYSAPRFDTGDERYAWLNRIQAVGKGVLDGDTLTYDLYELR
jgi:hypothetical protein